MWRRQGNRSDDEEQVGEGQRDEETTKNCEVPLFDEDVDADNVEEDANNTDANTCCTDDMAGHINAWTDITQIESSIRRALHSYQNWVPSSVALDVKTDRPTADN